MLWPDDADLVRREAALPGLALVLDAEAFGERLQQLCPPVPIQAVQAAYVRYKPDTSCLVAYRMTVADQTVAVTARAYRADEIDKLQKARQRAALTGVLGAGSFVLDDAALVITVFPNDRRLKAVPVLATPAQRQQLLQSVLPDQPALWAAEMIPLHYKPERRFVARLQHAPEQALLKVYSEGDYENARRAAACFASSGPLQVPRLLARSRRNQLLISEWLPGQPLNTTLSNEQGAPPALQGLGAALARFHAQLPRHLIEYNRPTEAAAVEATARTLVALVPGCAEATLQLTQQLTQRLAQAAFAPCAIHGDFSADQVLHLGHDTWAIVDLDAAGCGDPMADLGMFAAHLYQGVALGQRIREDVDRMLDQLLAGYRQEAAPRFDPSRFQIHLAARLLRLAVEPFRRRMPGWATHAATIVQQAAEVAYAG